MQDVLEPQALFEKMGQAAFQHKNGKVREEVLFLLQNTLNQWVDFHFYFYLDRIDKILLPSQHYFVHFCPAIGALEHSNCKSYVNELKVVI